MVDSGGLYALEEMDMKLEDNHMPFTTGLEQKYKQYVKSTFMIHNYDLYTFRSNDHAIDEKGKEYQIVHLEDVMWSQKNEYDNTIFIVNLDILEKLRINNLIFKHLVQELSTRNNIFYDMDQKTFLEIRY